MKMTMFDGTDTFLGRMWREMNTKSLGLHEYRDFDHFAEDIVEVLRFRRDYYPDTPVRYRSTSATIMYVDKRGWVPGNVQVYANRGEIDRKKANDHDEINAQNLTQSVKDYGMLDMPPAVRDKIVTNLLFNENYLDRPWSEYEDLMDVDGIRVGTITKEQGYE